MQMALRCPKCDGVVNAPSELRSTGVARTTCPSCDFAFVIRLGEPAAKEPAQRRDERPTEPLAHLKDSREVTAAAGEIGLSRQAPSFLEAPTLTTVVVDDGLREPEPLADSDTALHARPTDTKIVANADRTPPGAAFADTAPGLSTRPTQKLSLSERDTDPTPLSEPEANSGSADALADAPAEPRDEPTIEIKTDAFGDLQQGAATEIDNPFASAGLTPQIEVQRRRTPTAPLPALRLRRRESSVLRALLMLLAPVVTVTAALALFVLARNDWSLDPNGLTPMVRRAFGQPSDAPYAGLKLGSSTSLALPLSGGKTGLVVRGTVNNQSTQCWRYIYVRATLTHKGQPIVAATAPAANVFDLADIRALPASALESRLNPSGQTQANLALWPGQSIPYQVVLRRVPANFSAARHSVTATVAKAEPCR